jgi:predicted lipoprotein
MREWLSASIRPLLALALLTPLALSGCKIVSIEADKEARARRSEAFEPSTYIDGIWDSRVLPTFKKEAVPFADLDAAIQTNLAAAGAAHGRQAADSSPWTFVTQGSGTVVAIHTQSRTGDIEVDTGGGRTVMLETGPVIVDTAVRDALPFLTFNDFSDQTVYAGVGAALTRHALRDDAAALDGIAVGDRIKFLGAFNISTADDPVRIIAVRLQTLTGPHA